MVLEKKVKKNEKSFCLFRFPTLKLNLKGGAMWSRMTMVVRMLLHRSNYQAPTDLNQKI